MASEPLANPRFSFGQTVTDMFGTIGRKWLMLCGLALLLSGLPNALYSAFAFRSFGSIATGQSMMDGDWFALFGAGFVIGWFITFLFAVFAQAAMTSVVLRDLHGRGATFGDAFGDGLRFFLPVLAITLIFYLVIAVVFAFPAFLLIAGAIGSSNGADAIGAIFGLIALFFLVFLPVMLFFAVVWIAAIPAAIQERLGPIAALQRSWTLSRGHRWKLAAMIVIFAIAIMMVSGVASSVTMPFMTMSGTGNPEEAFGRMMPIMAIQSFLGSLTLVVTYPALAATYVNLRNAKEGAPQEMVAEIFE
jgi:hypothetical protein